MVEGVDRDHRQRDRREPESEVHVGQAEALGYPRPHGKRLGPGAACFGRVHHSPSSHLRRRGLRTSSLANNRFQDPPRGGRRGFDAEPAFLHRHEGDGLGVRVRRQDAVPGLVRVWAGAGRFRSCPRPGSGSRRRRGTRSRPRSGRRRGALRGCLRGRRRPSSRGGGAWGRIPSGPAPPRRRPGGRRAG